MYQHCSPIKLLQKFLKYFVLATCSLSLTGCPTFLETRYTLKLDAPAGVEIGIYQISKKTVDGHNVYIPIAKIIAGQEVSLQKGTYFLANECSGIAYEHTDNKVLKLKSIKLDTLADSPSILAECFDPIDNHRSVWTSRLDFSFLPSNIRFFIGGRPILHDNPSNNTDSISLSLFPLSVRAISDNSTKEEFFVTPYSQNADSGEQEPESNAHVVSVGVGQTTWLLPGLYSLEVNGTHRIISVDKNSHTEVPLGILRVDAPSAFPLSGQLQKTSDEAQPVFAYINDSVLFNLNNDYYVFPGQYNISIGASDVKSQFKVESGQKTIVKTRGAQINMPPCDGAIKSGCRSAPKITIHSDRAPYALMTVDTGVPFLVFEGIAYQYGVEGARGLLRELSSSSEGVSKETLSYLQVIWEPKESERRTRTDLVRIESSGQHNFGKTLDLLFHKPDALYLPPGLFHVTYNLVVAGGEVSKVRREVHLNPGQTTEIRIPIFPDKNSPQASGSSFKDTSTSQKGGKSIPSTLPAIAK